MPKELLPLSLKKYIPKQDGINNDIIDGGNISTQFKELQIKYDKHVQNSFISKTILEANFTAVKSIIGLASVPVAATGVGALPVIGVNMFMDSLLDKSLDLFEETTSKSRTRLLSYQLNEIVKNNEATIEEIANMSVEDARMKLRNSKVGIMSEDISGFSDSDKIVTLQSMNKMLEDTLTVNIATNARKIEIERLINQSQYDDINTLKSDTVLLTKMHSAHEKCIEEIKGKVDGLQKGLKNLKESVGNLSTDVDSNTENILFLKQHIFSNADIETKLKWLENGALDKVYSDSQKAVMKKQYDVALKKKELRENIHSFLYKTNQITTILNNVGFDDETVRKANELVSTGKSVMTAYAAYSSGDVLGAAVSISSLFGSKGSPDPAAQRHQQVMAKLTQIDKKLDTVLLNQQKIMEVSIEILKQIDGLSEQVKENHSVVLEQLHQIKSETLYNRLLGVRYASQDLFDLEEFSNSLIKEKRNKAKSGTAFTYSDIQKYYSGRKDYFIDNQGVFQEILNVTSDHPHAFLLLKTYEESTDTKTGNEISILNNGYSEIINYLEKFHHKKYLSENTTTVFKYNINCKDKFLNLDLNNSYIMSWNRYKSGLLFSAQIKKAYDILSGLYIFYTLQNENNKNELYAIDELINIESPNEIAKIYFENILEIINASIIQENLLSGDFMLTLFYEKLFGSLKLNPNEPEYSAILRILESNELLKYNFSNYLLNEQLSNKQKADNRFYDFEYFSFLNNVSESAKQSGNKQLNNCFDENVQSLIYFDEEGFNRWALRLSSLDSEVKIVLPNFVEYNNNKTHYRRDMYELLELKICVLDKLSEYNVDSYLHKEDFLYKQLNL